MAKLRYEIPGIGGSLGSCAVCGDTFLFEIMTSQSVDFIFLSGFNKDLPVHKKCAEKVIALQGPWKDIRESFPEGPLKKCFDEQLAEELAGEEREP